MKKLALLFVCTLTLSSCEIEDDGPQMALAYAEVVSAELPESFEKGETYEIPVTFLLPSACHEAYGLRVERGAQHGEERRDIYIVGMASYDPSLGECPETDEDPEIETEFSITIDEDEAFTFYLWTGTDIDGEAIFDTIEVPVEDPDATEEEE